MIAVFCETAFASTKKRDSNCITNDAAHNAQTSTNEALAEAMVPQPVTTPWHREEQNDEKTGQPDSRPLSNFREQSPGAAVDLAEFEQPPNERRDGNGGVT
eukprot:GHVS01057802.1.p2 GENE.GHVS01057802.1~~GHVS01057802.1.p2  ORF type:complete len:101 (+),score=12.91 GHVS01057802.1:667-969(+)